MSRIDELIQELCPGGVPMLTLGELLDYEQPGKYLVASTDYRDDYPTPVLTAGQTFVLGYTNETHGIYPASDVSPVLIFDDFTTAFRWVDFPFKAKSSAMKMLTLRPEAPALLRFVYLAMQCIGFEPQDHARHWIGKYSAFRVPVPPFEVQREIVRVLDKFTQLEAELEAELEARRAQYEHYRSQLLDGAGANAALVRLGDLGRIVTGRTPKSSDASAWGTEIDFVTPSDIRNGMKSVTTPDRRLSSAGMAAMVKAVIPANSLLVTCIGADMGKTVINANDCVTNQQINSIVPIKDVVVEYFFHLLTSMRERLRAQGERAGGTMPLINKTDFSKIEVPVPSLEVQKRVAAKLDDFDALINDISIGLPAELAARRKQYEHYRDRLLTFKELAS